MKLLLLFALSFIALTKGLGVQKILRNGNNQFTANMFSEVVKINPSKSVVLSAFSVIPPLAQLAEASEGASHEELLNAVGFPDDNAVENQTNQRIKDLIDPGSLSSDTKAVLVNALYFKGAWKHIFIIEATEDQDFYVNKGESFKVPMMYNSAIYKYKESDRLKSKILELPHDGDQSSLIVVLPNDVDGIKGLLEELKDPNVLDEESESLSFMKVNVHMPKFKIETTTNLKEILQNMNVTKIFTNEANLTKLFNSNEKLKLTDAIQKCFIDVNEMGIEAAAANVFGIAGASFMPEPPIEFMANHPFVFFLKANNIILFNGVFYGR